MKDQRGKRVNKGAKVAALIAVGAQVIGRVVEIHQAAILFEADVAVPAMPEQPAGCLVLVDEGVEERQKERWTRMASSKKLKIFDQRENQIVEGSDIAALMPQGVQIVGTVTEFEEPRLTAGRGGRQWRTGIVTLKAYVELPVVNGRAPCLLLPPEQKEDSTRRDDGGIIIVQ